MATSNRSERDANTHLATRADSLQWKIGATFAQPAPRRVVKTRQGIVARIVRAIVGA